MEEDLPNCNDEDEIKIMNEDGRGDTMIMMALKEATVGMMRQWSNARMRWDTDCEVMRGYDDFVHPLLEEKVCPVWLADLLDVEWSYLTL